MLWVNIIIFRPEKSFELLALETFRALKHPGLRACFYDVIDRKTKRDCLNLLYNLLNRNLNN